MICAGAIIEIALHVTAQRVLKEALVDRTARRTSVVLVLIDNEIRRDPSGTKVEADWNDLRIFGTALRFVRRGESRNGDLSIHGEGVWIQEVEELLLWT